MIKAIFFDVGGTLVHPDLPWLMKPLWERMPPQPRHLAAAERAAKCGFRPGSPDGQVFSGGLGAHAGPVNHGHWQTYFEALLDALGCGRDLLATLTERAGDSQYWTLVDPTAASVLEGLRRHFRLAVISNADGNIDEVLRRSGLSQFFETTVDSGILGYEKPDPRIFQAGLERMQMKPRESLYIGDMYAVDYRGARGVGMPAVLIDPNGVYEGVGVARIDTLGALPGWIASQGGSGG